MNLEFQQLTGRFMRLEPFAENLKEKVRAAIDCDPETWAIMQINPTGKGFENYWSVACGASPNDRLAYAIRRARRWKNPAMLHSRPRCLPV